MNNHVDKYRSDSDIAAKWLFLLTLCYIARKFSNLAYLKLFCRFTQAASAEIAILFSQALPTTCALGGVYVLTPQAHAHHP